MPTKTARGAHIFERDPLDWYCEPSRCTAQLLKVERFVGPIWDACAGAGATITACRDAGYTAWGTDVVRRVPLGTIWWRGEHDFLADTPPDWGWSSFVMNPPYFGGKGTEAFIRRALSIATGKVCVFVDRRFLTGQGRARGLFREFPPTRVWEITPRPSCPPGTWLEAGNKAGGGTADYAWLVWDLTAPPGPTSLGWLTV